MVELVSEILKYSGPNTFVASHCLQLGQYKGICGSLAASRGTLATQVSGELSDRGTLMLHVTGFKSKSYGGSHNAE
jgi:hypothetical protein